MPIKKKKPTAKKKQEFREQERKRVERTRGSTIPTLEFVKKRLVELRTQYRDVPSIRYPSGVTAEIASLEKRLRQAGITYIGKPPRRRKKQ